MKIEQWKDVIGYPGYQISSMGNAVSFWRRMDHKWKQDSARPKPLLHSITRKGYHMIRLQRGKNDQTLIAVHTIMLEAFVGPRPSKRHHACHIDDDKDRNVINNLRWGTPEKNLQERFINHGGPKLFKGDVIRIKSMLESGKTQQWIADEFGVTQGHISRIRSLECWNYI